MRIPESAAKPIKASPLKALIVLNTTLIFWYHPGVVFAMAMSMAQATSNQQLLDQLYWVIPMNLLFASVPNFIVIAFYFFSKQKERLFRAFIFGEIYVVIIQLALHIALLIFAINGTDI